MYLCMYAYTSIHVCKYIYIYIYLISYLYMYRSLYLYLSLSLYIYIYLHIYVHIYIYICIHTHVYTCIHPYTSVTTTSLGHKLRTTISKAPLVAELRGQLFHSHKPYYFNNSSFLF